MLEHHSTHFRWTTICVATVLAISLPSVASAGIFNRAKNLARNTVVYAGNVASNVQKNRPVANALRNTAQSLPGAELIETVKQLNLKEQLQNTIALMQQMQSDYRYFSGGTFGCESECATFRNELKSVFNDFLSLVDEVPVLSTKPGLYENIERVSDLIDYVPPRALYLMWQALDGRTDEIRAAAEGIRQLLESLPPLEDVSDIGVYANMAGTLVADSMICEWATSSEKPFVDLVQAELERIAWVLKTVESFIPDIEIKAEVGADGGVVVVNISGSAGAGFKPTDAIKIALKLAATIPEAINWAIKLNTLRAKALCAGAELVAN